MSKINKIVADFPILKQAIEAPDREQHERDFSQLAFAFLQDRASGLLPYLLGFEVVDREDDGSKAVGIFGFNISGHYYYVPAFFINSQIKGMDLLFNKSTNNFVPLQEEWIDRVINKSGIRLGRRVESDDVRQDFESPDLTDMIEPPVSVGKSASVHPTSDLSAHLAYNAWNAMQKTAAEMMKSDKAFQEAFAGAIAAMSGRKLEKSASSDIVPFIENLGGPNTKNAFMRSMQNVKYANAFFSFYDDLKKFNVTKYAAELEPVKVTPDLRVSDNVQDVNAEIKDENSNKREKARLITDGFAIIDNRKSEAKSTIYPQDLSGVFSVPDEAGVYDLWTNDGKFKEVAVVPLMAADYCGTRSSLFIDLDNSDYCTGAASNAIASRKFEKSLESVSKPLSSLNAKPENQKLGPNENNWNKNVYCIFDPDSNTGFVASLDRRMSGHDGHLFSVYHVTGLQSTRTATDDVMFTASEGFGHDSMLVHPVDCCSSGSCPYISFLKVSTLEGKKLVQQRDTLIVPNNFRVIKLAAGEERSFLGSLASLDAQMFEEGFSRLDVDFDGTDYSVKVNDSSNERLSKKEACISLIANCGLSVSDADELIARAESGSSRPVILKMAQITTPMVGVDVPMPIPPGPGTEMVSGMGLPMETPYIDNQAGSFTGVPAMQDSMQPGFADGGQSDLEANGGAGGVGGVLPDEVMQLADQAAQSGQKHVFDHSTIAGLAGLYDIGYAIDMYIPELTKSLDRIGRILFIFYWKNNEFAERYGEQDLAGMEDLLRNVFKSFGSLVLRLQEKTITDAKEID